MHLLFISLRSQFSNKNLDHRRLQMGYFTSNICQHLLLPFHIYQRQTLRLLLHHQVILFLLLHILLISIIILRLSLMLMLTRPHPFLQSLRTHLLSTATQYLQTHRWEVYLFWKLLLSRTWTNYLIASRHLLASFRSLSQHLLARVCIQCQQLYPLLGGQMPQGLLAVDLGLHLPSNLHNQLSPIQMVQLVFDLSHLFLLSLQCLLQVMHNICLFMQLRGTHSS